jgi:hypothetical protein
MHPHRPWDTVSYLKETHAGWQREHMSQNRLAILPSITHYEIGLAPQLVDTALPFLNGQGRPRSWNEQVSAK